MMMKIVNSLILVAGADAIQTIFKKKNKGDKALTLGDIGHLGVNSSMANVNRESAAQQLVSNFGDILGSDVASFDEDSETQICVKAPPTSESWGLEITDEDAYILSVHPDKWADKTNAFADFLGWHIVAINSTPISGLADIVKFKATVEEGQLLNFTMEHVEGNAMSRKVEKRLLKNGLDKILAGEDCADAENIENQSFNCMAAVQDLSEFSKLKASTNTVNVSV